MPFLWAAGLSESAAEAALKLVQSFVEGVRGVVRHRPAVSPASCPPPPPPGLTS